MLNQTIKKNKRGEDHSMTLNPSKGKAVIEVLPDEKVTPSGLILAETVKDIPHRGKLIALGSPSVGDNGISDKLNIPLGSIVHFKRQWSSPLSSDGVNRLVIKQEDIIAYEEDYEHRRGLCALRDNVIIRRVYTGKVGNSTIMLADVDGFKSNTEDYYGEVLSVGDSDKLGVSVGMKLLYHRNEGLRLHIPFDYNEYFTLKPRAILAELVG